MFYVLTQIYWQLLNYTMSKYINIYWSKKGWDKWKDTLFRFLPNECPDLCRVDIDQDIHIVKTIYYKNNMANFETFL